MLMFFVLAYVGMFLLSIAIIIVGIIGIVVSLAYSISIAYYLYKPMAVFVIDKEGIIDKSTFPRIGRIAWNEIHSIYKANVFKKTSIYVKLNDNQMMLSRFSKWKGLFIKWNTPKGFDPIAISLNLTGMSNEELIEILDARVLMSRGK